MSGIAERGVRVWDDTNKKWIKWEGEITISGNMIDEDYDYIELTYVVAGDGAGEIETAIYKTGGAGGTTVATLTLAYDASDRLSTVTKT